MRYAIRVPDELAQLIAGLHPDLKRKLRGALAALGEEARLGKPLKDELAGYWSLRIGKYRLIYRIAADERIVLFGFGARDIIYQETLRLIRAKK